MSRSSPPKAPADASARLFPATVPIPGGLWEPEAAGGCAPLRIAAFHLGRTPVTNREFAPFLTLTMGRVAAPPWWDDPRFSSPGQPVVGVAWADAIAFCDWLTEGGRGRWRLPTEAEWELAASAGLRGARTPWGDAVPPGEIPEGPLDAPWETGRGTPNGYGLLDPGTVVHEWCLDWSAAPPTGSGPRRRASRGGSWRHAVRWSAPSAASSLPPELRYSDYGFRALREETERLDEKREATGLGAPPRRPGIQ